MERDAVFCYNKIKSTNSSNEKKEMLKIHACEAFKEALHYCYHPFMNFYMKKDIKPQKIGHYEFIQAWLEFKDILDSLNKRKIVGNEAKRTVTKFLEECNEETQYILTRVLIRDMGFGMSEKSINDVYEDLIPTFIVGLANKYDLEKDYKVPYFWASPKMDGLRGRWDRTVKGGEDNKLRTREGNLIEDMPHIKHELEQIADNFGLNQIDGEFFHPNMDFNIINGIVMGNKNITEEQKRQIPFVIFMTDGITNNPDFPDTDNMVDFIRHMEQTVKSNCNYVTFVPYEKVKNSFEEVDALCKKYVEQGYEGAMLRHPEVINKDGKSDYLLKYKLFYEDDFIITGWDKGKFGSKRQDEFGSFRCGGSASDKKYQDVEVKFNLSSGLKDEDIAFIKEQTPDTLVDTGMKVEVKFQEISKDKNGNFSLRFPVFQKFKVDRK